MAEGDVLLRVRDVKQNLGGNQILDGVTFDVVDRVRPGVVTGQLVGLLGPSGVGKTRLLRILAGLDPPDTGFVQGPDGLPMHAGTVGVVFQNYPLLRHRTIFDNLVVAGITNDLAAGAAKDRASELLRRFGLGDRGGFYPAQLSGGQRQRAAIAQQLVAHKPLLLLDEPFSGLDPASLEDVSAMLVEVAHAAEHNTLIVVTHDIRAAMLVSDTLMMLGRDRAPDGTITSGARIQKAYDLVAMNLAWREKIDETPEFAALERQLKAEFRRL